MLVINTLLLYDISLFMEILYCWMHMHDPIAVSSVHTSVCVCGSVLGCINLHSCIALKDGSVEPYF